LYKSQGQKKKNFPIGYPSGEDSRQTLSKKFAELQFEIKTKAPEKGSPKIKNIGIGRSK
jgi:hypothetical protein